MRLILILAAVALAAAAAFAALSPRPKDPPMQFTGPDAALERAINADDAAAVDAAVAGGANPNARGAHGVTPLEYAIGTFRKTAARALIRHRADPNVKDAEGDNAVAVAVTAYARDPELLELVLDAGGDPNTRRADGSPVITYFGNARDMDAITYLHAHGADLDILDDGTPLVVGYANSTDWDVVWHLIQRGARTDTPRVREGMLFAFKGSDFPSPDSPLYPFQVKVWRHLKAQGLDVDPPKGM